MGNIYTSIDQLIGHTPLLELSHIEKAEGLRARVLAKLESFNPGWFCQGPHRACLLDAAEEAGVLTPGEGTVIEPTSGNTGIGLAMVAAARGYRAVIVMPDTMSIERRRLVAPMAPRWCSRRAPRAWRAAIERANETCALHPPEHREHAI